MSMNTKNLEGNEMRRISKIVVAFGIGVLISILFDIKVSSAATEEQFLTPPTEETLPGDLNEVIQINPVNTLANSYLLNGKSFISATGDKATISGNTRAQSKVDKVSITLYLQRWNENRNLWETVVNLGEFSNSNATIVNGGQKVTLLGGYHYRARALHSVTHKGKTEPAVRSPASIYIK